MNTPEKSRDALSRPSRKSTLYTEKQIKNLFHDIRAPLSNILASADCMKSLLSMLSKSSSLQGKEKQKTMDFLKNIRNEVWKIEMMLNNFSEYHHKHTLSPKPANLKKMLNRLIDSYQNTYSHGVRTYELYYSLPEEMFIFDKIKLTRAIENLLSNSTKFTPQGMIMVEVSRNDRFISISIKDSGIGIMKKDLPHIFDLGYQGKKQINKSGSGIGLFNVKTIVEMHRGTIEVTSRENKGTVIRLNLPLVSTL